MLKKYQNVTQSCIANTSTEFILINSCKYIVYAIYLYHQIQVFSYFNCINNIMKKSSIVLMVTGIVIMVAGCLIFRNLNYVNAVDSHSWTININGLNSFPWVAFTGMVLFVIGIVFNISSWEQKGHRVD